MAPGPDGVESDNVRASGRMDGRCRLPLGLEPLPRFCEPRGDGVRDVVVAGDDEERSFEVSKKLRGPRVLFGSPTVGQVAACDQELGAKPLDECQDRAFDLGVVPRVPRADMEIRHVEDAGAHRRSRLQ